MFPFDLYPGGGRKPLGLAKGGMNPNGSRRKALGASAISRPDSQVAL